MSLCGADRAAACSVASRRRTVKTKSFEMLSEIIVHDIDKVIQTQSTISQVPTIPNQR